MISPDQLVQPLSVSLAHEVLNEVLAEALPVLIVEGEVSGFKLNQQKFIFFDIKDSTATLGCFMMAFELRFPIKDGMRVRTVVEPSITKWGKFSLRVREVIPIGEGDLKKSKEILKSQLESEGLFDVSRKRVLPKYAEHIGVVGSSGSAAWQDFLKITKARFGGLKITLAETVVQGSDSPSSIIASLARLNNLPEPPEIIAIIRGGGSQDDLMAFDAADVVRAIASSRIPTITGVGHENDVSLADLAADKRASTPSNVAELITADKKELLVKLADQKLWLNQNLSQFFEDNNRQVEDQKLRLYESVDRLINDLGEKLRYKKQVLESLNPERVLKRGYAMVRNGGEFITSASDAKLEDTLNIKFQDGEITTKVINES